MLIQETKSSSQKRAKSPRAADTDTQHTLFTLGGGRTKLISLIFSCFFLPYDAIAWHSMRLSYHSGFATLYKKSLVCFFLVLLPSWLLLLWLKLSIKSLNHKYFFLFERCEARCGTACVIVWVCVLRRVRSWARNFWLSKVKVAAAANAVERNVVEKWQQQHRQQLVVVVGRGEPRLMNQLTSDSLKLTTARRLHS